MVQTTEGGCGTCEAQSSLQALRRERECCLLVLNSVTSTPQWIHQPEAASMESIFCFCKNPPRDLFAPLPPASAHQLFIHCLRMTWYVIRGLRPVLRARISLSLSLCIHIYCHTMIRFDSDSESGVLKVSPSTSSFQHSNLAVPEQRVCAESSTYSQ